MATYSIVPMPDLDTTGSVDSLNGASPRTVGLSGSKAYLSNWDVSSGSIGSEERHLPVKRNQSDEGRTTQHPGLILLSWWAWELVGAAVSLFSAAALVGVLAWSNGQAQQSFHFGYAQISLNTMVAALATIVRASLLVVVAGPLAQGAWNWFAYTQRGSRPPPARPLADLDAFGDAAHSSWSSLKLLWHTKGASLAALGAVATVLAFFFGAFVQQSLDLEVKNGISPDLGPQHSLPRAGSYLQVNQSDPYMGMSWFSGVANPHADYPTSYCATGNCTWPTTPTLAVCSSCLDATSDLVQSDVTSDVSTRYRYLLPISFHRKFPGFHARFPDTLNGVDQGTEISFSNAPSGDWANVSLSQYQHSLVGDSPTERLILNNLAMIGIRPSRVSEFTDAILHDPAQKITREYLDSVVFGYSCMLYMCLQAYNGSTTLGNTTQTLVSTWSRMERVPGSQDLWQFVDVPPEMNIEDVSEYRVADGPLANLTWDFAEYYGAWWEYSTLNGTQIVTDSLKFTNFAQWRASDSLENISQFFARMADGVTNQMRVTLTAATPKSNATLYAPQVWKETTFVRVRWLWLTFPLIVFVISHVFMTATILETRGRQVRPWKQERLPLLLTLLDSKIYHSGAAGLGERHGARHRVGDVPVRLVFNEPDRLYFERDS